LKVLRGVIIYLPKRFGYRRINHKRQQPNARINSPPDNTTQASRSYTTLMKDTLRAFGLNELLCGAYLDIFNTGRRLRNGLTIFTQPFYMKSDCLLN
jgi:hypothetical protein